MAAALCCIGKTAAAAAGRQNDSVVYACDMALLQWTSWMLLLEDTDEAATAATALWPTCCSDCSIACSRPKYYSEAYFKSESAGIVLLPLQEPGRTIFRGALTSWLPAR
jgi:hypothetical protein